MPKVRKIKGYNVVNSFSNSLIRPVEKSKLIVSVSAKNTGQKNALQSISNKDNFFTFLSGPAGCGKSFIATAWALEQVIHNKFDKLIITRPWVEAGEKIGWIPGSLSEKMLPFTSPLFDVIKEFISVEDMHDLVENEKIVVLPFAFMRGCSIKNAIVVADETQNTTVKQMHMLLTRLGENSKMIITGDPTQSDLGADNGFSDAIIRLDNTIGVSIIKMDKSCIVRHPIIQSIVEKYENKDLAPLQHNNTTFGG